MAVSYQNVADAAQALIDEGKNLSEITVMRVRSELGTGSNGTITPFLARWKRTQEDKAESSSINLLSTELQNLLNAEIGRLLKKSKETSSRRIADLEKLLEETNVNLQASEHKNTKDSKLIQTLNSSLESLEKKKSL